MPIDKDTHYRYTNGGCAALAYHLHLITNLPLVTLGFYTHVVVKVSKETYLDIGGIRTLSDLREEFHGGIDEVEITSEELKDKLQRRGTFRLEIPTREAYQMASTIARMHRAELSKYK